MALAFLGPLVRGVHCAITVPRVHLGLLRSSRLSLSQGLSGWLLLAPVSGSTPQDRLALIQVRGSVA